MASDGDKTQAESARLIAAGGSAQAALYSAAHCPGEASHRMEAARVVDEAAVNAMAWAALHCQMISRVAKSGSVDVSAIGDALMMDGAADMFDALVAAGTDLRAADASGFTALHSAAAVGLGDVCWHLVALGADVHAMNKMGRTALHCAADAGHADACSRLITAGADVRAVDKHGKTALHLAAGNGHGDACSNLLAAGAIASQQDFYAAYKSKRKLSKRVVAHAMYEARCANVLPPLGAEYDAFVPGLQALGFARRRAVIAARMLRRC